MAEKCTIEKQPLKQVAIATQTHQMKKSQLSDQFHDEHDSQAPAASQIYHDLLKACPIGLVLHRPDGTFVEMNPAFATIIGYTLEEALTLNYWDITGTKSSDSDASNLKQLQLEKLENSGNSGPDELEYLHAAGHLVPVRIRSTIIKINSEDLIWSSVEEITDQKLRETEQQVAANCALSESESRFRRTVEQAAIGMAHLDLEGKWLFVNQRICEILGYQWEQLSTLTFQDLTYPDDLHTDLQSVQQLLAGEIERYSMEKRYIRKDRSVIWANLTVALMRSSLGEPQYFISTIEDISGRKGLEKELAFRQALFNAFFTSAPAGLVILDHQLRYVQLNEALAEINGVSVASHLGKTTQEILPELAPALESMFHQIMRTGEPLLNTELVGETPKRPGVIRHWTVSYFPLWQPAAEGNHSEKIGIGGVIVEVTERKRAEEQLRRYKERLEELVAERTAKLTQTNAQLQQEIHDRIQTEAELQRSYNLLHSILESTPDPIFVKDLQGRYVMVNSAAAQASGKSIEEFIGRDDTEIFAQGAEQVRKNDLRIMAAGVTESVEEVVEFQDGVRTYLSSKSPWRDRTGNVIGLIGMVRDISERKKTEEALLSSERALRQQTLDLEQTLRELQNTQTQLIQSEKLSSLGQLVAGVAHEINNPVNFIYGNLTHIKDYTQN